METIFIIVIGAAVLMGLAFLLGYELGECQKKRLLDAAYQHGYECGVIKGQRQRSTGARP